MILLKGKPIRDRLEKEILKEVHKLRKQDIIPHLAVILVGNREDSELYVALKKKKALELGIDVSVYRLNEDEGEESIIETIMYLNKDKEFDGIIVQLPLPEKINIENILSSIDEKKDVDDLRMTGRFIAPSPQAIVEIIDKYKIATEGKHIVIMGKGRLIGRPLEKMLKNRRLDVKAVDSGAKNLIGEIKKADILIAATGTNNVITEELVKENAVVISVGGEVNFERVKNHVEAITPNVGGVGPITVALLLRNVVIAASQKED